MLENTEGVIKVDNPEKLATWGTFDKKKHNTIRVVRRYVRKQT